MAKILVAKVGTDAHDMGITVVSRWLTEAGHEVRSIGIYNTPKRVAEVAQEFQPDIVGLSFLGAEPVYMAGRVADELALRNVDTALVVGGVITPAMMAELEKLGVKAIFTPGTSRESVLDRIASVLAGIRRNAPPAEQINPLSPQPIV
jgi:methylmalonyl-CoA mutase cobalamin-binding domain/chain